VLLGLGGGAALSRALTSQATSQRHADDGASTPPVPRDVYVVGPSTARLGDDDKAALRALLREELAAQHLAAARDTASAPPEESPMANLSHEQLKSYDEARSAVDDAIARGVWTSDSRADLRGTTASLPAQARVEIAQPLVVAVNSGKVHFEGHGPLL
jgi:hypothetical protein